MTPAEAAALTALRAAFGETVRYTGAGLEDAPITAIYSTGAAPAFQGPGATAREVSIEIERGLLLTRPRKGDTIVRTAASTATWKVIDATERDDIDAWVLIVEALS